MGNWPVTQTFNVALLWWALLQQMQRKTKMVVERFTAHCQWQTIHVCRTQHGIQPKLARGRRSLFALPPVSKKVRKFASATSQNATFLSVGEKNGASASVP